MHGLAQTTCSQINSSMHVCTGKIGFAIAKALSIKHAHVHIGNTGIEARSQYKNSSGF